MVDVIVPVYNSLDTLRTTLNSISSQSVVDKVKVTLVDDCSDDDYADIIMDFKNLMDINFIRLEKNSGSGVARQVGIDNTCYNYITFIDSDDVFYDDNSLEKMYNTILEGYDIVSGAEYDEYRKSNFINEGDLHGKLYRRSFIDNNNIRFNSTRFHEDNYFNSLVLLNGANNYKLLEVVYIYCYNDKSITRIDNSKEFERLEILLYNISEIFKIVDINDVNREIVRYFIFIKYKYFNRLYKDFSDEQREIFRTWVTKYNKFNVDLIGISDVLELKKMVYDKKI